MNASTRPSPTDDDRAAVTEVIWWQTDDLWFWSLEALVTCVGAAAEHAGIGIEDIRRQVRARHGAVLEHPRA
jgi:hypothetical protein